MFHFLFINITHLISITKDKLKCLTDLCDVNAHFYVFVKLFSTVALVILKSKYLNLLLPGVIVSVCLGWCLYLPEKYVNFITCVNYSNSQCVLLILKLHSPSLIVILIYRPPS